MRIVLYGGLSLEESKGWSWYM